MKTQLVVLFFTLFLSVNLLAQNPTWFGFEGSMNYTFHRYDMEGYNEQAYLWQDALLKGNVQTCTITERITDSSLIINSNYGMYSASLSYNMEFRYNEHKQLEKLIVNHETIEYKKPKVIENVREESLFWILGNVQNRDYWIDGECEFITNYIYNDAGQIKKEQWSFLYQSDQSINVFPFEVLYEYKKEGGYTITGTFKEDFDSEKGIVRYLLEFNKKGQLLKRTLYNRELRSRAKNDPSDLETFMYTYNEEGYLTSMTFTAMKKPTQVHWYKYVREDKFGNWQLQQVYDDKKVLLFEMERQITYEK